MAFTDDLWARANGDLKNMPKDLTSNLDRPTPAVYTSTYFQKTAGMYHNNFQSNTTDCSSLFLDSITRNYQKKD